MLTHGLNVIAFATVFWGAILQAAPITTSFSEDPSRFQLFVESGPILASQTFVLNFGSLWDVDLSVRETADPSGDILDIDYRAQHATATHPGIPPLGPLISGSISIDARPLRGQPGLLAVSRRDTLAGHGSGRNDFLRIRLYGFSASRQSDDFESWSLDLSGGDVPEPSSFLLCMAGGVFLVFARSTLKKRKSQVR